MCDNGNKVVFEANIYTIYYKNNDNVFASTHGKENVFTIDFNNLTKQNGKCLSPITDSNWLWHNRLGHASMKPFRKLSRNEHDHDLSYLRLKKIIFVMMSNGQTN